MNNYMEFDTCPCDEKCVSVDPQVDYMPAMREEANRYMRMLQKRFPNADGYWRIARNSHDFGDYLEVRFCFAEDTEGEKWAYFIEAHLPETWEDTEVFTELA